jgi:hypothetical protein
VAPSKACLQFFGGIEQSRFVLTSALRSCLWFFNAFLVYLDVCVMYLYILSWYLEFSFFPQFRVFIRLVGAF